MDLADLGATRLAQMIQNGEISSLELTEACLKRIEEKEGDIGAWAHLDPDYARRQAIKRDDQRATGIPCGPLHGIPVGIKDIFDTEGFPTENGTVQDAGRAPMKDCTAVSLLKAAGAVILGKTVTAELAVLSPGKTRNPHDLNRTPGGSSSGSAAAVAAGMVPLAIGSQTNGSVIRPASFCGIVGFKPTHGRISRAGALELSRNLDHVGVFGRSIDDVALISDCLIAYDPADPDTRLTAGPKVLEISREEPPLEPRVAFIKSPVWDQADPATQEAFEEIHDFLGDQCDEIAMPAEFDQCVGNLRKIMYADLARHLASYIAHDEHQTSDILKSMIEEGRTVSAVDYNISVDQIGPLRNWVQNLCDDYDVIMTPATCGEAPLGLEATGNPVFCTIWTYLGVPAVTVPLMQGENGMPLGVQLVATGGDDARLLRSARWLANKVVSENQ